MRMVRRRLASASSSAVGMNVPPSSELKVALSWLTAFTSACLVSAQNPVSSTSGWKYTGASARSRSNWSCGHPPPPGGGEQVDPVEGRGHRHRLVSWCRLGAAMAPRRVATAVRSSMADGSMRRIISRPISTPITAAPVGFAGAGRPSLLAHSATATSTLSQAVCVAAGEVLAGALVAGGVGPELVLEPDPAVVAGGRMGDVAPERGQAVVEGGGGHQLGRDHGRHVVHPALEQGEEEPLLAAEVVVDRARRALGGFGDGVDRAGLDPPGGEQVSGGVEEALARLRSPLPLRGHRAET